MLLEGVGLYAQDFEKGCLALDWYPEQAHAEGGMEDSGQRIQKPSQAPQKRSSRIRRDLTQNQQVLD